MIAAEDYVREASDTDRQVSAEIATEIIRQRNLRVLSADSDEVRIAMREASKILPQRPRDYKRFVNAVRLQLLVDRQSLRLDETKSRATTQQIAKATALSMRWPLLVSELRRNPELIGELEQQASNGATPDPDWSDGLKEMFKDARFRDALVKEPLLRTADLHGLLMVR